MSWAEVFCCHPDFCISVSSLHPSDQYITVRNNISALPLRIHHPRSTTCRASRSAKRRRGRRRESPPRAVRALLGDSRPGAEASRELAVLVTASLAEDASPEEDSRSARRMRQGTRTSEKVRPVCLFVLTPSTQDQGRADPARQAEEAVCQGARCRGYELATPGSETRSG